MLPKIGHSFLLVLLSLLTTTSVFHHSLNSRKIASTVSDFTKVIPNKYYFTLGRDLKIEGPVFDKHNPGPYFEQTLGLLIQKADSIAKEDWFLENDSNQYYYAFLLGALTVPFHESYWILSFIIIIILRWKKILHAHLLISILFYYNILWIPGDWSCRRNIACLCHSLSCPSTLSIQKGELRIQLWYIRSYVRMLYLSYCQTAFMFYLV